MANPHNLKVGQELFLVTHSHRRVDTKLVTIATLGRKWFTHAGGYRYERFDMESLKSDSQWSGHRSRCYLSQAHWDAEVSRKAATSALYELFSGFSKPELQHLSTSEIEELTAKIAGNKTKDTQ